MIQPAGHRVLVRVDETEKRTKNGLIIPDSVRDRETQAQIFGELIAVGPNAWKAFDAGEPWAFVGDRVAIAKYGGFIIKDPETGEEFRLLNDEDICAVLTKGD